MVTTSGYSRMVQHPIDVCMRSLGVREMALTSGTVK
jgi:hypothetical protein